VGRACRKRTHLSWVKTLAGPDWAVPLPIPRPPPLPIPSRRLPLPFIVPLPFAAVVDLPQVELHPRPRREQLRRQPEGTDMQRRNVPCREMAGDGRTGRRWQPASGRRLEQQQQGR
jgi:hypothetical protein